MRKSRIINFIELQTKNAKELSELLIKDDPSYRKYFIPFDFSTETIKNILKNKIRDFYIGIYCGDVLTGFYILRGFDQGYKMPSYGVYVHSSFSRKGLSELSLLHAISTCKLLNIKKIMLKVHPENQIALNLYLKHGFIQTGFDEKINNLVLHKEL